MFERLRAWLIPAGIRRQPPSLPPDEDRSSGEDARATIDRAGAEATPSRMNRLKTERL
jgi:hypothetical protein